jgi:hypothetical protein
MARSKSLYTRGDASVRPSWPRSSKGFVFNMLMPGNYMIEILLGEQKVKSVSFTVTKIQVTDLGDIIL